MTKKLIMKLHIYCNNPRCSSGKSCNRHFANNTYEEIKGKLLFNIEKKDQCMLYKGPLKITQKDVGISS